MTREALERIELESQSWEYASEMVLKSVCLRLKTVEVPVRFLKEPEGRLSHMKRNGWLEPWRAGWINLKAMFLYGTDFFLLRPVWCFWRGLAALLARDFGPGGCRPLRPLDELDDAGADAGGSGAAKLLSGLIVQVLYNYSPRATARWLRLLRIQPRHGGERRPGGGRHRLWASRYAFSTSGWGCACRAASAAFRTTWRPPGCCC